MSSVAAPSSIRVWDTPTKDFIHQALRPLRELNMRLACRRLQAADTPSHYGTASLMHGLDYEMHCLDASSL